MESSSSRDSMRAIERRTRYVTLPWKQDSDLNEPWSFKNGRKKKNEKILHDV